MYQSKGSSGGSLNSGSGESQLIDLRTNGFDLLTTEKDFNKFSFWITSDDVLSLIHFVFDDVLTKTWLNYQTVENANKVDQLKKLKTRRQKRFQKEARMKADEELKLSRFYSWKATLMESNKLALSRSLTSTKLSLLGTFLKLKKKNRFVFSVSFLTKHSDKQAFVNTLWKKEKSRLETEASVWGCCSDRSGDGFGVDHSHNPRCTSSPLLKWKLDLTEVHDLLVP